MSETSYDLVDRPWIAVLTRNGAVQELSLSDTLGRAHELIRLAGELPTQDVAVTRVLLAVLRRSLRRRQGVAAWADLFTAGRFDVEAVRAYLEPYRPRFDLLHSETPFLQVAGLRTAKGEMTELGRLIADVPPKYQYFTTRAGREVERLRYAEAARWLVHCHAFDPSGIKSGAIGDDRVKGGKGYPIGKGWCGNLGCVVLEGRTLFETLMLNLSLVRGEDSDLPAWERDQVTAASSGRYPDGHCDLLTWQSRRIRLGHDGDHVTSVLIANGDALHQRNTQRREAMTSWRYSEPQTKAHGHGSPVFMPREHIAGRQIWRGLAGLLAESETPGTGPTQPPEGGWLTWLSELRYEGAIPADLVVRVRTVAMHYGSNDSVIDDVVTDALAATTAALATPRLRTLAADAVRDADTAAQLLARYAGELAEAGGDSGDGVKYKRDRARELAYGALDADFRRWLVGLEDASDLTPVRLQWQRRMHDRLWPLARDLALAAGPQAWTGREVSRGPDRTVYLDAGRAELSWRRGLRESFPGIYPTTKELSA